MRAFPVPRMEIASYSIAGTLALVGQIDAHGTYLADITEPHVGQGAGSLAVDTFKLVLSNDHIAQ
jgi:hypothetical protein